MAAMTRLREQRVLFGASVTYTSQNVDIVTRDDFLEMLIDRGCLFAWYFMYVPVGRNPDLSLMVTPEQRRYVCETTWRWMNTRPIFVADFWNSGALTQGCIAAGRSKGYLHVTHRGDIGPCVFMMYSNLNLHETDSKTPLLDAVRSDFFRHIRQGQGEAGTPGALSDCRSPGGAEGGRGALRRPFHPGGTDHPRRAAPADV